MLFSFLSYYICSTQNQSTENSLGQFLINYGQTTQDRRGWRGGGRGDQGEGTRGGPEILFQDITDIATKIYGLSIWHNKLKTYIGKTVFFPSVHVTPCEGSVHHQLYQFVFEIFKPWSFIKCLDYDLCSIHIINLLVVVGGGWTLIYFNVSLRY